MKTAGRENRNHGVAWPRNRAHGAVAQNRSRSLKWAAKQEKFQPKERSFFLTSTFIEPSGSYRAVARIVFPLSRFSPVSDGAQPHAADQRASWIDHPPIESKAAAS